MTDISVVFSTVNSKEKAESIAEALVQEHTAACVNITSELASIYRWQNKINKDKEFLMIIKTGSDKVEELIERLLELHPYELPEIVVLPVANGLPGYLQWIVRETR
jgi:periplasmic divalent cation tolerance protein